jgi:hypothetical protein
VQKLSQPDRYRQSQPEKKWPVFSLNLFNLIYYKSLAIFYNVNVVQGWARSLARLAGSAVMLFGLQMFDKKSR